MNKSYEALRADLLAVSDISIVEGLRGNESVSKSAARKADRLRVHTDHAFKQELKAREVAFHAKLNHLRTLSLLLGCQFSQQG